MEMDDVGRGLRLAYITQWFAPEPLGPSTWIAQALQERGFDVHVVTAVPNYPAGVVYEGYRATRRRQECVVGVSATRCPVYPSHDRSALKRALNYLSFAISATLGGWTELKRADVVLVYSSPATAALPAAFARLIKRRPFVLYIQDLWPDSVLQTGFIDSPGIRRVVAVLLGAFDRAICRAAQQIVVIAPGMKSALVERGVPEWKVEVVHNWVDEDAIFPGVRGGRLRTELGIGRDEMLFMYAGNHGTAQGLAPWLESIAMVADLEDLHFVFLGTGTERESLRSRAKVLGLERTHFIDAVPLDEYVKLAPDADAQIVSLRDESLFRSTIPGKLQVCMALGSPVLASIAGDAEQIVRASGAGFTAVPGSIPDIVSAIRTAHAEGPAALRRRGESARREYVAAMSRDHGSAELGRVLNQAVRGGRRGD